MMPMQPPASAMQAAPSRAPESQLDPEEIAQETGYSVQRVMADIQRTGATDKASLYPQFYGANSPGIEPDAARLGSGMPEEEVGEQSSTPDEAESPQRLAARAAMSGQPVPMHNERTETPAQERAESPAMERAEQRMGMEPPTHEALGAMAQHRKRFSPHERVRKMRQMV